MDFLESKAWVSEVFESNASVNETGTIFAVFL